jgi:hypothetical protein
MSAGTIFRVAYLVLFLVILAFTSFEDSGDRLTCTVCICLFSFHIFVETHSIIPVVFTPTALYWSFYIQPAVLNRCHLTVWLLVLDALRNLAVVDDHVSFAWGFSALRNVVSVVRG